MKKIVAILATYNEERFIAGCLEHLFEQGVKVYMIDNCSTDRTVEIAGQYQSRGLIGMETLPREGSFALEQQLKRKEELAATLDADWFMHVDADEIRLPPNPYETLAEAIAEVDSLGYNAVNFLEFTFVPTREEPDHDHPRFQQTMHWYYPFILGFPSQVKAWKKQPGGVGLARFGGHRIELPGLRLYPIPFKMRHYPFLSAEHFTRKYVHRKYDPEELRKGWHRLRSRFSEDRLALPSHEDLNCYTSDEKLSLANPRSEHIAAAWALPETGGSASKGSPKQLAASTGAKPRSEGSQETPAQNTLPIIVGGCYRSGTSMLRRMLNAHPRIYCGPEVKFFRDFYGDYVNDPIRHGRFLSSARRMLSDTVLLRVLGQSFVTLHKWAAARAEKPRWADKNPENVLYLEDWQQLLGDDWLFVHMVRNPLDTLASIKEAEFPRVIPPELDKRIEIYKRYTQAGLDFAERHPERYYRVVYEEMAEQPERVLSELMQWLGEELDPVQLDFNSANHQKGLEDPKVSHTTTVHSGSVGRWKELLTAEEADEITRECEPLWRQVSQGTEEREAPEKKGLLRRLGF